MVARCAAAPTLPTIPAGVFKATRYGALANGSMDDTSAIQAAINAARVRSSSLREIDVSGTGTIDGHGSAWRTAHSAGLVTGTRPTLLSGSARTNVMGADVTLTNAPDVPISFVYIHNNVTMNGITINKPINTPGTGGIAATGTNIMIENSSIADGDDNIAIGGRGSSEGSNQGVIYNATGRAGGQQHPITRT